MASWCLFPNRIVIHFRIFIPNAFSFLLKGLICLLTNNFRLINRVHKENIRISKIRLSNIDDQESPLIYIYTYIYIRNIMTRKSGKHLQATYGTLNNFFDLIGSHQQCTTGDRTNNHSRQKPKLYPWATGSSHSMPN